jgi:hypothetical protein
LLDVFNTYKKEALSKLQFLDISTQLQISKNQKYCHGTEFKSGSTFPKRMNPIAWARIYSSYLDSLLFCNKFAARATLNLRLVALSIHGGLYMDCDVGTDDFVNNYNFNKFLQTKFSLDNKIKRFTQKLKVCCEKEKINLFFKFKNQIRIDIGDHTNIEDYMDKLLQYRKQLLTKNTKFLKKNKLAKRFLFHSDGIYAISSSTDKNKSFMKYSQNVLYVQGQNYVNKMKDCFVHSLYFNMTVSMLEPESYIFYKTNQTNLIVPKISIGSTTYNIKLQTDVFYTRKKYPYLVMTNRGIELTLRTGRPLHPVGQMATRGSWNFIINILEQLEPALVDDTKIFSAKFNGVALFPENSVVYVKSYHDKNHWTKIK